MPRFDAASISITSSAFPLRMLVHTAHSSHGVAVMPVSQFSALASTRAVLVFPVPRGPANRYACATRPDSTAFISVWLTCGCPTICSKRCGRYLSVSET